MLFKPNRLTLVVTYKTFIYVSQSQATRSRHSVVYSYRTISVYLSYQISYKRSNAVNIKYLKMSTSVYHNMNAVPRTPPVTLQSKQ